MKIKTIILTIIIFSSYNVKSQEIKFNTTEYDYGIIKEEGGLQKGTFSFTNVGSDTLKLISVRPGCGCTASDYTKAPIPPGGQGFIDATYNPSGRPGKFKKSISVTSNCKVNPNMTIYIKGEVTPRPKTKADLFPQIMGNLRLKNAHISFNDLKNTEIRTDSIGVYNNGKQSISMVISGLPAFLKVSAKPIILEAGQEGSIVVSYDGSKRGDWGFLLDQFTINTNDVTEPLKYLTVSANILEDFSALTPKQMQKAPKIAFDTTNYNFGTITAGGTIQGTFNIKNTGKDKLIIRKITSSCECITFSVSNYTLKKNASGKISFVYDTKGKPSRQHKTLAVITNDPKTPVIVLHIQGTTE